jgi:hypothetical protein
MVQRLTLRKKRKSKNVRGKRRRMTYRKMVHKQTLGKKRKSQNVRGTRRIMTYKKTGRYNIEGGDVHAEKVEDDIADDIADKYVLKIPIYLGKHFLDKNGDRLDENTVYRYNYNVAPKRRRLALEQILNLQKAQLIFKMSTETDIGKAFTYYETNSPHYNNTTASSNLKKDGYIYFKITDETSVSPPGSPKSVMGDEYTAGGGKRRQRIQQGLKQNKLQTIKKYYKNK